MELLTRLASQVKIRPSEIGMDPVTSDSAAVGDILGIVYMVAGMVSVVAIILAGFWYVTSNGQADRIKRAKNAILAGVIGLVVVIMAFTITQFVLGRFT